MLTVTQVRMITKTIVEEYQMLCASAVRAMT